jgi:hypothetical protein
MATDINFAAGSRLKSWLNGSDALADASNIVIAPPVRKGRVP